MAYDPSFQVGEIVATTIQSRTRELADNVSNSNALLAKLSAKGNVKPVSGGDQIWQELMYAENDTFLWYEGDDEIFDGTASAAVIDTAIYDWKQCAVSVYATGKEVNVQNTGKERMIDMFEGRISNAFKTMANKVALSIYGDATDPKEIDGLQLQIADDPTAVASVGTIPQATNTWWQNQTNGATVQLTSSNIQEYMQNMWLACTRGQDVPDLIAADLIMYQYFWASLTDIQRISSSDKAVAGFKTLMFNTADVIYDGDSMGTLTEHMYFINTDYMFWRPHSDVNMVADSKRITYNKDSFVVPILFAGNLTCSNRSLQGVLWQDTVV